MKHHSKHAKFSAPTHHSASSIGTLFGLSTITKPLTTTNRTRFSSCITNSGNLVLVSIEVANSLLLNVQGPAGKKILRYMPMNTKWQFDTAWK